MPRAGSSNDVVAPDSDSENSSEPSWWIPSDEEDDQGEDNPEEPPSVMAAFDSLPPVPTAPYSHGTTAGEENPKAEEGGGSAASSVHGRQVCRQAGFERDFMGILCAHPTAFEKRVPGQAYG